MSKTVSKTIAMLLLGLMVLLIVASYDRMIGSYNQFLLSRHLEFWANEDINPDKRDLDKMDGYFQTAIDHIPNHADVHQAGGLLSEWYGFIAEPDSEEKQLAYETALDRYRKAIALRPDWPYFYMDMAKVKLILSEADDEFKLVFTRGLQLGPNQPKVQDRAIQLGLLSWQIFDEKTRALVKETIDTMIKYRPDALLAAAEKYEQLPRLCTMVDKEIKWYESRCSSY